MYLTACFFVSAQFVRIAIVIGQNIMDPGVLCLSAPRADRNRFRLTVAVALRSLSQRTACRSQPQARQMGQGSMALSQRTACRSQLHFNIFVVKDDTLSQRTACRSQRQMCTKHRVRICGMRCESVDSFSQHEDLLRADYFPELFCYQSSLRCH